MGRSAILSVFVLGGLRDVRVNAADDAVLRAESFTRKVVYHSPETPGYTCWTGAWTMPDGSLMISFTQATAQSPAEGKQPRRFWRSWTGRRPTT